MKNSYQDNVCAMFRRKGLAQKYEHPGIYCIKLNNQIVYIGKSQNMLERIAQHYVGIKAGSEKKYRILAEAQRKGYAVHFDVLYYAEATSRYGIIEEIGQKEGELIRQYRPILNTQIPKEENWRQWEVNKVDAAAALALLLDKYEM